MDAQSRIRQIIDSHPVVLFMKGTPEYPMCGYSECTVRALQDAGARFEAVNVNADPEVRAALPRLSNWHSFPQLFINGELIGGCDIAQELAAKGELAAMVVEAQRG